MSNAAFLNQQPNTGAQKIHFLNKKPLEITNVSCTVDALTSADRLTGFQFSVYFFRYMNKVPERLA